VDNQMDALSFATIADMTATLKSTLVDQQAVLVGDHRRGGEFRWDAGSTVAQNDGTTFEADEGGTGRWQRVDQRAVLPQWFGAVGNSVHDDTGAFQAAIDYTQAVRGQISLPPPEAGQHYRITSTLMITAPLKIVGSGAANTPVCADGLPTGDPLIYIDGTVIENLEFVEISDLKLLAINGVADLILLKNASNSAFRDLAIGSARHGIVIRGDGCDRTDRSFSLMFDRVIHIGDITGSAIFFENSHGGGQYTFTGCSFGGSDGVFIDENCVLSAMTFVNCNFERCTTTGVLVSGQLAGLTFIGCRSEKCEGLYTIDIRPVSPASVRGISVQGCFFETDAENFPINLGGGGGVVRGFDVAGCYAEGYGHKPQDDPFIGGFVSLNAEAESGGIHGNYVDRAFSPLTSADRPTVVSFANESANEFYQDIYGAKGSFPISDASGAGLTLVGSGTYSKVGRLVYWQAVVTYPSTASTAPSAIDELPFIVAGLTGAEGRAGGYVSKSDSLAVQVTQVAGDMKIELAKASGVAATNADLSNTTLYLAGFYTTL